jgi:hypothetical protein
MILSQTWGTRDTVVQFLSEYAAETKVQIDEGKTSRALLKSYVFETFDLDCAGEAGKHLAQVQVEDAFRGDKHDLQQIDEHMWVVNKVKNQSPVGFLERINDRFSVLYSIEKAQDADNYVNKLLRNSSILDSMWISGKMFDAFWKQIQQNHAGHRYIKMKFEFDALFDDLNLLQHRTYKHSADQYDVEREVFDERRVTSISLVEELAGLGRKLEGVREFIIAFYSIGLLRFPSFSGSGGHDFYRNGKVTNRCDNFLDHRSQIFDVIQKYEKTTECLEDIAWLDIEKYTAPDRAELGTMLGTPIVFEFRTTLKESVFHNFISYVFPTGREPFRIIGDPIWVTSNKVHVYGMDLHLWQKVMLELTRERFIVILPRGTCGNTIHRLVTNVQRFIDPTVLVSIGSQSYDALIKQALGSED